MATGAGAPSRYLLAAPLNPPAVEAGVGGSLLLDPHNLTLDARSGVLPHFTLAEPIHENQSFGAITQVLEDDGSQPGRVPGVAEWQSRCPRLFRLMIKQVTCIS
jgi:hypothetical protein